MASGYKIDGVDLDDLAEQLTEGDTRTPSNFQSKYKGPSNYASYPENYSYAGEKITNFKIDGSPCSIANKGRRPSHNAVFFSSDYDPGINLYINRFDDGEVWVSPKENSKEGGTQISTASEARKYFFATIVGAGGGGGCGDDGGFGGGGGGAGGTIHVLLDLVNTGGYRYRLYTGMGGEGGIYNGRGNAGEYSLIISSSSKFAAVALGGGGGQSGANNGGGGQSDLNYGMLFWFEDYGASGSSLYIDEQEVEPIHRVTGGNGGARATNGKSCTWEFNAYTPEQEPISNYLPGGAAGSGSTSLCGGGGGSSSFGTGGGGGNVVDNPDNYGTIGEAGSDGQGYGSGGGGGAGKVIGWAGGKGADGLIVLYY